MGPCGRDAWVRCFPTSSSRPARWSGGEGGDGGDSPSRRLRTNSNRDISAGSKPSIENAQFCSFCSRAASRPRNGLADTPIITAARCRAPGSLASRHGLLGTTVTPAAGKPWPSSTMALPSHHQGDGPEQLVDLATTSPTRRGRWCRRNIYWLHCATRDISRFRPVRPRQVIDWAYMGGVSRCEGGVVGKE